MNVVVVVGTPEKVAEFANAMAGVGNYINHIKKTKSNASYIVIYGGAMPFGFLLMEDGSSLLLESGGKILL
jgi:hypothetical protein